MATKYKSSYWTRLWRSIHKLEIQGVDKDLIQDLQSNLHELDLEACGKFYFLDEDDEPAHVWYVAVYDDNSARLQVRNGPSVAFPDLETMLKFHPLLAWVRDARRDDSVQKDNAVA